MARKRSDRVAQLKTNLIEQLLHGAYLPGEKFHSARSLASSYSISYQTSHRILNELYSEGYVARRPASGTYVPGDIEGTRSPYSDVRLIISERARRSHSFGARLLAGLADQFRRQGIPWQVAWAEGVRAPSDMPPKECLCVLWEAPRALQFCVQSSGRALLLNERPQPGLETALIDSVSLDDYFGGCCAADLLLSGRVKPEGFAVVTGPDDPRSNDRRDGFLSRIEGSVVRAGGWYREDGLAVADTALQIGKGGIFCVNDRLAQAVLHRARELGLPRPRLVGFDNAPIADELQLTTIAIPWNELIADAVFIVKRRLGGDISAARRQLVTPRPIIRKL